MTITWQPAYRDAEWECEPPSEAALTFHRGLDGYAPTPLIDLPTLAAELGVSQVVVKDESHRLGLPAFKALGASWAVHRALAGFASDGPATLVTATDGNHGRAVARFAHLMGHRAHIVTPGGVHPSAVRAIRDEGADVIELQGSYDEAVAAAAMFASAEPHRLLVQDTAWEGYEEVPGWIVDGYATMFAEIDDQLHARGITRPDLVAVPAGVGSLLQSALTHYRSSRATPGTAVVSVEPDTAACVQASVVAGEPVTVETGRTTMVGLNCGTVSTLAWPHIRYGLDGALIATDAGAARAAADLAWLGVDAGPCGGSGLAALRAALAADGNRVREHLGLDLASTVVLLITEGSDANPSFE